MLFRKQITSFVLETDIMIWQHFNLYYWRMPNNSFNIPKQAQKKVLYNIWRVTGGEKNKELFKKLENSDIWEFRTLYNGIAYRLFAFWDTENGTLVIATHGIIKKTQKPPPKEIAKAETIMKRYFELKEE